jgi:hypothetical protein
VAPAKDNVPQECAPTEHVKAIAAI